MSTARIVRDLIELGKPRVTLLVLLTTAVGLWLAPGGLAPLRALSFLLATAGLVVSANTLNCWIERSSDGLMRRTRERPLPAGRLDSRLALVAGLLEGCIAAAIVLWSTNLMTALLGSAALLSYVLIYTPMKRRSWLAVIVGAVPGAIPPLMGWTAVTGALDAPGWFLFSLLFLWQLPHFIAISLYLKEDYRRGGILVLPLAHGDRGARWHLFVYTVLLVVASLAAAPLQIAGTLYAITAGLLGAGFLVLAARGLQRRVGGAWARQTFAYSLVYLTVLIGALVVDAR